MGIIINELGVKTLVNCILKELPNSKRYKINDFMSITYKITGHTNKKKTALSKIGYSFTPKVYFLFNKQQLIYIGVSKNPLRNRFISHLNLDKATHFTYVDLPISSGFMFEIEKTLIQKLNPTLNIRHND